MTIVDLSDLDTFIRDSLYEVRRGIANSRNATQANPLLGVMVDLPDKVDFEIMVTSGYQGLVRQSKSVEDRNDFESTAMQSKNARSSEEGQTSTSKESLSESSKSNGNEKLTAGASVKESEDSKGASFDSESKQGGGSDKESKQGGGSDTESKQGGGFDGDTKNGSGTETDKRNGLGTETDKKNGSGTETDKKSGSGLETDIKSGSGSDLDQKNGSGTETDQKNGSGIETDQKNGSGTETDKRQGTKKSNDTKSSLQTEQHLEANDRASKSFDEEEGSWGPQGQISTPKLPGNPCKCGGS
jgi:hypothetical protein